MTEVAVKLSRVSLERIANQATPEMAARLMYTLLMFPPRGESCYYIMENGDPFVNGRLIRTSDLRRLYVYNQPRDGGWFPIERRQL